METSVQWSYDDLTQSVTERVETLIALRHSCATAEFSKGLELQASGAVIWWQTLVYRHVDESRYDADNEWLLAMMKKFRD